MSSFIYICKWGAIKAAPPDDQKKIEKTIIKLTVNASWDMFSG